ncbi:hypothetical protein BCY89_27945 [Sphingobacterium siyangense]|uniref:Pectate lyase superfamily protein domain-containing protein n=1 Tax=Sphingobacterium siyangense TaxID=459529 RepID=A0A420FTL3_9SPHI|nr:hypothetical protein [Sphingobacterium siyangense]RKF36183.1 hypothetical protein BCY89_27945 [Sphingobacterium siyangense]
MTNQFLIKNTMQEMKALDSTEINALESGIYAGVQLLGYYEKGDTPSPIVYNYIELQNAADHGPDNGGSIIVLNIGGKMIHNFDVDVDVRYFGAKSNQLTDNSNIIQKCINTLMSKGGNIHIPIGCYFYLDKLVFTIKVNLIFSKTDDRSRPSIVASGTNETVLFLANANNGGIVNEYQLSAAFHPGHVVDVRDDITGQDNWLGVDQERENPSRASYNIRRQGVNKFRIVYQHSKDRSKIIGNGTTFQPWRSEVVLNGISQSSFINTIAIGDMVTGNTSKGYGIIKSIETSSIAIVLEGFKFIVGESVVINGENSSTVITSQLISANIPLQAMSVDDTKGYWGFGTAPYENRSLLSIAGELTVAPTRSAGQYIEDNLVNSTISFIPSVAKDSYSPSNGLSITMDNSRPQSSRRLTLTKRNSNGAIGHIGAVRAYGNLNTSTLVNTSSFNVSSIVRNSSGDFTVQFTTPFARADYIVALSSSNPMELPYVFTKTIASLRIRIANTGSSSLVDPTGAIGFICIGGDI